MYQRATAEGLAESVGKHVGKNFRKQSSCGDSRIALIPERSPKTNRCCLRFRATLALVQVLVLLVVVLADGSTKMLVIEPSMIMSTQTPSVAASMQSAKPRSLLSALGGLGVRV